MNSANCGGIARVAGRVPSERLSCTLLLSFADSNLFERLSC